MVFTGFLAMTAAELGQEPTPGWGVAWMGCHFSPYGRGLSNLPPMLPRGSLVLVDDWNPIHAHDPALVAEELEALGKRWDCTGVLLDFQRPVSPESEKMVAELEKRLTLPLILPAAYGTESRCAVCLPMPPCHVPLKTHLAPWAGREVWLELTKEGETILVNGQGSRIFPGGRGEGGFSDENIHCHYCVKPEEGNARFNLWRTSSDLAALIREAESLGVRGAVGLWQELGGGFFTKNSGST